MDCSSRSGGSRLKDRLTQLLLRPANTFLRSPCSSSSSTSTVFTAAAAATMVPNTSTSTSTTAANYASDGPHSRAEPFSVALDRLGRPPPERMRCNKEQRSTSSRHSGRRRFKNAVGKGGVVKALSSNPYGFTSSGEEDDGTDDGYGNDDTETFLSSRSLMSSDSSGFYTYRKLLQPPSKNKSHLRRQRRRRRCCRRPSASCVRTCGTGAVREPGFRPLVAKATATATATAAAVEQARKGLAVVKRSQDPYGDFRESMVEMIMGRQVFGAAELERLLRSYLSLNAPRFHPVILQAFSDVWVVLHGGG